MYSPACLGMLLLSAIMLTQAYAATESNQLLIATSMAQCRATCITQLAPSSTPGVNTCSSNTNCTQCWSTCAQLAEHYPIYNYRCRQTQSCTLGCSLACGFFIKANATPPPTNPQHPSVYIPPKPPSHPTPPARLSMEFDQNGASWTLSWVDHNAHPGSASPSSPVSPVIAGGAGNTGGSSALTSECSICGSCGVVFAIFTQTKHHLPWVLYRQTQSNHMPLDNVTPGTHLQLIAVASCGIVSVIITPYNPPAMPPQVARSEDPVGKIIDSKEAGNRYSVARGDTYIHEQRYETLAQHYARKSTAATRNYQQQESGVESFPSGGDRTLLTDGYSSEGKSKNNWDLHYNASLSLGDLIYTSIWWTPLHVKDSSKAGADTISKDDMKIDYLVTWEDKSGTLKGHSITNEAHVSFDLYPHTQYKIRAEVVMGPLIEPMTSNILVIDAAEIYNNISRTENSSANQDSQNELKNSDNYVYANVDTNYTPQFVKTVPLISYPVITPIPFVPVPGDQEDRAEGIMPESEEREDPKQRESASKDNDNKEITTAVPSQQTSSVDIDDRSVINGNYNNNRVDISQDDKSSDGSSFQRYPSGQSGIESSNELRSSSSDRQYSSEDISTISSNGGLSTELLAGIISAFVIVALMIVVALFLFRYRNGILGRRSKGSFTASSNASTDTSTASSVAGKKVCPGEDNHQWVSLHQPAQVELLNKGNNLMEISTQIGPVSSTIGEDCSIRYSGLPVKYHNAEYSSSSLSQSCDSLLMPMIPPSQMQQYPPTSHAYNSSNASSASTNTSYLSNASNSGLPHHHTIIQAGCDRHYSPVVSGAHPSYHHYMTAEESPCTSDVYNQRPRHPLPLGIVHNYMNRSAHNHMESGSVHTQTPPPLPVSSSYQQHVHPNLLHTSGALNTHNHTPTMCGYELQEEYAEIIEPPQSALVRSFPVPSHGICYTQGVAPVRASVRSADSRLICGPDNTSAENGRLIFGFHADGHSPGVSDEITHSRSHSHSSAFYQTPTSTVTQTPEVLPRRVGLPNTPQVPVPTHRSAVPSKRLANNQDIRSGPKPAVPSKPVLYPTSSSQPQPEVL